MLKKRPENLADITVVPTESIPVPTQAGASFADYIEACDGNVLDALWIWETNERIASGTEASPSAAEEFGKHNREQEDKTRLVSDSSHSVNPTVEGQSSMVSCDSKESPESLPPVFNPRRGQLSSVSLLGHVFANSTVRQTSILKLVSQKEQDHTYAQFRLLKPVKPRINT